MEGNDVYLPHEIILKILIRLPVKSIIRFQCVCKNWKNLSKDPLFIANHLHQSCHRPSLLLHRRYGNGINDSLYLRSFDCDFQLHEVDIESLINFSPIFHKVRIIGCSNGLLCVGVWHHDMRPPMLLLWNPAIKEFREVPSPNISKGKRSIGFGFSTIANDYKIIKIDGYKAYPDNENLNFLWDYTKSVNGVEVYSLSTGLWKEVECGTLEGVDVYSEVTTVSNGAIIWLGQNQNDKSLVLISFDMAMEVFTLIPMPPLYPMSIIIPTIYDNRLAILSYYEKIEYCSIHLWVIEENTCASGGRSTWTKKYNGNPDLYPRFLIPQNIWGNEIVCTVDGYDELDGRGRTLYLLNLNTNEHKKFVIKGLSFGVKVFNHAESLVPVGKRIEKQLEGSMVSS